MKIENTEVFGFCAALRSMRNPLDSWDKSDTIWGLPECRDWADCRTTDTPVIIGVKDLELAKKLIINGSEHRKFLRLIQVWATWTLPRYVWTEADTYKVGMTRMSCSTMHKLGHRDLETKDFQDGEVLPTVLEYLNDLGRKFRDTKDYSLVRKMKKALPESFLQKADVNFNYETAMNMFRQRKNHRLPEWRLHDSTEVSEEQSICDWLYGLPHFKELVE
jgi:hypothetical protein